MDRRVHLGKAAEGIPRRRMIEIIEVILIDTILPGLNRNFSHGLFETKCEQVRRC